MCLCVCVWGGGGVVEEGVTGGWGGGGYGVPTLFGMSVLW